MAPPFTAPPSSVRWDASSAMSRRAFAAGTAVTALLAACHRTAPPAAQAAAEAVPEDPAFLSLSIALTGHADIDPLTAARTSQAFHQLFPEIAARFGALAALADKHSNPEELLDAADAMGQRETLLAIVAAWYTGTVGTGVTAKAMAYADALMNRPVADGLFPPTYQLGGPAWWTAAPPAVDAPMPPAQFAGNTQLAGKPAK
jgi:hypothetical protein